MPKDKPDNFGGLPQAVFDEVMNGCTTARIPPLIGRDDLVIEILAALVREEHAGAVGGPGFTGFWDANDLIATLRQRWNVLVNVPGGTNPQNAAIAVAQRLDDIGKQWRDVGNPDPLFYSSR